MNLDQNAVSLQPAQIHAIPTLSPRWPLLAPLLILRCDFWRPCCFRTACAVYSTSTTTRYNHITFSTIDGGVHVFEPLESKGKWGCENGSPNRIPTISPLVAFGLDQPQNSEIWIFPSYSFLIYVDCPINSENQPFHLIFCLFTNVQLFKVLLFLNTTI